jgi:hypothetical protein
VICANRKVVVAVGISNTVGQRPGWGDFLNRKFLGQRRTPTKAKIKIIFSQIYFVEDGSLAEDPFKT